MTKISTKWQPVERRFFSMLLALVMLLSGSVVCAQQRVVTGRVVDQSGAPVIGAAVIENGTTNGTTTNADGTFSLKIHGGGKFIDVQSLGFVAQKVDIAGKTSVEVKMAEDAVGLEAVVAIGYGTVKQKDLTTAVSIVSTKDLDTRPITTVSGALQGKAAGVQVIQPSGAPGEGMVVRVRGASSISSSNDPLYVVDGVPVGEGNYAIAYLSPNEIASMQVLKDASSAAIYGSRAANGVVLITTKQGSKRKGADISFSTFVGISKVAKTYDVLNAAQYRDLVTEAGTVTGLPTTLKDRTDWFKETYSTGVNQNYQFSVSNADENSSYYLGGGYTNEKGIVNTTSSERYNVKASFDKKIYKWVSANASITFSHYTNQGAFGSERAANRGGVVVGAITTPTYAPVWSEVPGEEGWYNNHFYGATLFSPSEAKARTENNKSITDRMLLSGGLTFNLAKGLTFKSTVSMDRRWVHDANFLDPIATNEGRKTKGSAWDHRSDDMRMIYDNILTYNKTIDRHSFEIMGGASATTSIWEELSGSRTYFSTSNTIPNLNGGNNGGIRGQGYGKSEWAIMSYLARATYNFDGKYLVTANFRADGSSKLSPKHRWGYFPSFSAAWRLSGENFLKNVEWINDLKLRAGWGQTGNQAGLTDYGYLQQYYTNYFDWTDPKYTQAVPTVGDRSNLKNEDLTWETTSQTNIGVDFSLLNNRLTIGMDYYYKYTKDLLMTIALPAPWPSLTRNEGEMSNKGFEFVISSVNIAKRDFNWSTDLNVSINRNKLEKLTLQQVYNYTTTSDITNDAVIRMTPGQPLSMFWGYVDRGVDPETGDLIYEDRNGDGEITPDDKTWIGNANPKFTFGMTNNFSWKGLNLSVLITGSYGNDIFNASRLETEGMANGNNQTTNTLRRWRIPGQQTDVFRAGNPTWNVKNSTYWVEDGSYLKVKNITLSYDITSPKLKRLNITRIQPYISLQNFITWTGYSGYDPEASNSSNAYEMGVDWGTYPNVRTVVVGLNLTF